MKFCASGSLAATRRGWRTGNSTPAVASTRSGHGVARTALDDAHAPFLIFPPQERMRAFAPAASASGTWWFFT
jgi:hypothetical protein